MKIKKIITIAFGCIFILVTKITLSAQDIHQASQKGRP